MNNTTYTANENYFLIDGEVYLTDKYSLINIKGRFGEKESIERFTNGNFDRFYLTKGDLGFIITHSTKPLDVVKQLPRDKFVKPKDVEVLAETAADKLYHPVSQIRKDFKHGFKAGYNANPNKFTIDHLKTAWAYGVEASGTFQDLIKIIIPLSLPVRLEINEQGEIVNVIW